MEYNFKFLTDLKTNPDSFQSELSDFMNAIDSKFSYKSNVNLLHIVPILYSLTFLIGTSIFTYKIINVYNV